MSGPAATMTMTSYARAAAPVRRPRPVHTVRGRSLPANGEPSPISTTTRIIHSLIKCGGAISAGMMLHAYLMVR
jgi:hypothetical protein